jgi:hypothetical protein
MLDAGILQPDRIQHAHRSFVHTMRRIAEPGLACRTLQHDPARVAIRKSFDAGVLLAETDTA